VRVKRIALFVALAVAGVLALLASAPGKHSQLGAAAETESALPPRHAPDSALDIPDRQGLPAPQRELFSAPPAPPVRPPPIAATPTVPIAPPLPYRYVGKVRHDGDEHIVLARGERIFPVTVGETLEGQYRVEFIGPDRIDLIYLPLGTLDRIAYEAAREPIAPAARAPTPELFDPMPAQLRWDGPARVQVGANFSVALRVSSKEALRAAPMQIRYEPDVMEPRAVEPGTFFRDGSFSYKVMPGGLIFVGASSKPAAAGADAELLVMTFRPLKRGATAELGISALNLQSATGRAIAHVPLGAYRAAIH
jgi:hypothetical protein